MYSIVLVLVNSYGLKLIAGETMMAVVMMMIMCATAAVARTVIEVVCGNHDNFCVCVFSEGVTIIEAVGY